MRLNILAPIMVVCALALTSVAQAQTPVPNPTVTGPIPNRGTPGDRAHDYPWMTTMHNLKAVGYVEEEFFYEGTARRFTTTGANAMNGVVRDGGHKYKTRLLVRRPINKAKFNGVVLAEWQNVTAGFDLDAMWGGSFEHIVRAGYIWVGVSPQRVGVQGDPNGLKLWSPVRYGGLDVTAGGTITDDSLSYDIFAQGLQAIKSPTGKNVLGGMVPKTLIAMGASQSAGRLGTYINALHTTLGGPVDGYFLSIGGARVREDLNVPVFKVLTETDVPGQVPSRQPDTAKFRHWEVAGASHSSRRTTMNSTPLTRRDNVTRAAAVCTYPTYPRVPTNYVNSIVYDHMTRWIQDGVLPPTAPKLEVGGEGGRVIQRDERGNARGGIRLAEVDPAVALNSGSNAGTQFCNLYGRYEPFSDDVIKQLYPTKKAYVSAARARNAANVRSGYVLRADAAVSNRRASEAIYGLGLPCAAACRAARDLVDTTYFYLGLSRQRDALGSRMAAVVESIAEGDKADATKGIDRYIADVRRLESRGDVMPVAAAELVNAANAVKGQL